MEKITFSSHDGQTAYEPLFSGQPLNIRTANFKAGMILWSKNNFSNLRKNMYLFFIYK